MYPRLKQVKEHNAFYLDVKELIVGCFKVRKCFLDFSITQ